MEIVALTKKGKGWDPGQDRTKRRFLVQWVQAVNTHGGFGQWAYDVSRVPEDITDILAWRAQAAPAYTETCNAGFSAMDAFHRRKKSTP